MELATRALMKPAKNIKELVVWQLACQLSEAIDTMVSHSAAKRHRKLCDQISRSSSSVAANLAEGFGRFHPRDNAGFVRIAKASLTETQNHLLKGNSRGCWRADDFNRAWRLSVRTMKAIVPYLRYLESCKRDQQADGYPAQNPEPIWNPLEPIGTAKNRFGTTLNLLEPFLRDTDRAAAANSPM